MQNDCDGLAFAEKSNHVSVTLFNSQSDLLIDNDQVKDLVTSFLKYKKISCREVIVHFVDNQTMCTIHSTHFADPSPTDCMTFPIDPIINQRSDLLGEIFICPKVAISRAPEFGTDPYTECTLYIIHALLHLLGFDDQTEEEREIMRHEEAQALKHLTPLSAK